MMEYVVFYNAGRDAARNGQGRTAPDEMDYPVYSNYAEDRIEVVQLTHWLKIEWLRGFDSWSVA